MRKNEKEHTSVDDFPAVKIDQAIQDTLGNLSQDLLAGSAAEFPDFLIYTVQASS